MKRWMAGWLMVLLLASGPSLAGFDEGRHYMEVPFPAAVETGNKVEVREFFWYGCPHCYVLEPGLTQWLKKLPKNARFVRTPGLASPRWQIHGQAYYTFEALGALEKLNGAFFKEVQERKGQPSDEKGIADFAVSHGIDRTKFTQAFNSFGVRLKMERAKQLNQELNINSVPTVVVDGRYLTSPAMAGGEDAFFKLLDQLINKAAKERKTKAPKTSSRTR